MRRQLIALLRLVLATEPDELDCDRFLHRMGSLLEGLEEGEDPPPEIAAASHHLEVCPECQEEFDGLLRAYEIGRSARADRDRGTGRQQT